MHFQEMVSIPYGAFVFSHLTRYIEIEKVMPYVMLSDSVCPFTDLTRKPTGVVHVFKCLKQHTLHLPFLSCLVKAKQEYFSE